VTFWIPPDRSKSGRSPTRPTPFFRGVPFFNPWAHGEGWLFHIRSLRREPFLSGSRSLRPPGIFFLFLRSYLPPPTPPFFFFPAGSLACASSLTSSNSPLPRSLLLVQRSPCARICGRSHTEGVPSLEGPELVFSLFIRNCFSELWGEPPLPLFL